MSESYHGVSIAIANLVKEGYPRFKIVSMRVINDGLAIVVKRKE